MSSTPLAETEEDVFDLTDAVPETERLDSSLQKAKAQLSIKTRRHRPSRSRLRDSLSSTEGDDSLDGKSCSGLLSGSCSPLHVSLRCPSPLSDPHPSSSPARKDRAFTFEITEREKKEQSRRSACLLNFSSPTHLLKEDLLQQHQEDHAPTRHRDQDDNLQLWQRDNLKLHNKENFHQGHEDRTDLHQGDHLLVHLDTDLKQGGHMLLDQENHIYRQKRDHLQKDHVHLQKEDHVQKDHIHRQKMAHLQKDHTHLKKGEHFQKDLIHPQKRDHLQNDYTHLRYTDHLQKDHTHMQNRDHLLKDETNLHNRDHFQTDQTQKDHEENHKREYSQSEDDARDIGSDELSSPTVLLDKTTRRRFLDLGVTLRRTYGKVRRERASRHAAENREPDKVENRSSRSSGPPFVPFSWLTERIRGSGSPRNSSQSPAKSLSEDEELKNDRRSSRNESSQPYQSLSDHSDEVWSISSEEYFLTRKFSRQVREGCHVFQGRDESAEPRVVKKKTIMPFSSGGRDRAEKQNSIRRDKRDDGHDGDGQKLLTSQSQCKHCN